MVAQNYFGGPTQNPLAMAYGNAPNGYNPATGQPWGPGMGGGPFTGGYISNDISSQGGRVLSSPGGGGSGDGFFNVADPAVKPQAQQQVQPAGLGGKNDPFGLLGNGQNGNNAAAAPAKPAAGGLTPYQQKQQYNANPPGYSQTYDPTGGMGYGNIGMGYGAAGGGNLNYTGQDPYQLAAISSQAGSLAQIQAAQAAANANMYGSHQGLLGTQDTNAANKTIAAGNNTTALGLGGMQENVGLTSAADQLAAARAAADASQGVAKTQAGASMYGADQGLAGTKAQVGGAEQVAQTQVGPDYAKLALQGSLLDKLFGGGTAGAGTGTGLTAPGGIGGGALGGTGTGTGGSGTSTGTAGVGTLTSVPTPATPQFNPMLTEQANARSNSIIQRNLQTQKNALADQYGQSGSLASGAGYNQDVGMLNNSAVQNEVSAENQNNTNALQFNSQNALPYAANAQNFMTTEQQLQLEQQRNQIAAQNPLYGLLGTVLQ